MDIQKQASGDQAGSAITRKVTYLAIAIAIAMLAYTASWFYLADRLEQRVMATLSIMQPGSPSIECRNLEVRGYPFRIGLHCQSVQLSDPLNELTLASGAFRSAAQIYRPNLIISEMDGPFEGTVNGDVTFEGTWQDLRASTAFALNRLRRASIEITAGDLAVQSSRWPSTLSLISDKAGFHTRENGPDLDTAFTIEGARLSGLEDVEDLPVFDMRGDVTAFGLAGLLAGERINDGAALMRGLSGEIRDLSISLPDGPSLAFAGDFSISQGGLVSGTVSLSVDGVSRLVQTVQRLTSDIEPAVMAAISLLSGLAGGDDTAKLTFTIVDGRVIFGLFPIAEIPPIL